MPQATTRILEEEAAGSGLERKTVQRDAAFRLSILSPVKSRLKPRRYSAPHICPSGSIGRPEMIEAGGEIKQGVLPLVLEDALGV